MPLNVATQAARLSTAPMMDWTDRHCRYFHRQMSRHALLYTEMVTAHAVIHGDQARLLGFDPAEHPLAVQLGGSDPELLFAAAQICAGRGFDEINLNCGCPSDRVQSGTFGAVLMASPMRVADCVQAMKEAAPGIPVTVKCRIGIDDQQPEEILPAFLEHIIGAGAAQVTIHARKAWLQGLSPKENREVPPLDYPLVLKMKSMFPQVPISINGGIMSLAEARQFLEAGLDGVMIGRAAYQTPAEILLGADQMIFDDAGPMASRAEIVARMEPYIAEELDRGTRLNQITRHMLGLFHGLPGARRWRRHLSENAHLEGAGLEVLHAALEWVEQGAAVAVLRSVS